MSCSQALPRAFACLLAGLVFVPQAAASSHTAVCAPARNETLSSGAIHQDAQVRRQTSAALAADDSAHGIVLLYLLAHDVDPSVQQSALIATLERCRNETPSTCAFMIRFFVGQQDDAETHLQARDWLLLDDPKAATQAASLSYKLDVVARMSERADVPELGCGARRVLRVLAEDPEPEVQEAAAAVLLRVKL